jgi:putative polyketide hydroxylase
MRTQVLIVGGGLVGLTASLLTGHHGVESTLVERHATTSPQPKARRFNTRTMEVYRSLGVAGDVEKAAADLANYQSMRAGPTLVDSTELPGVPPGDLSTLIAASPVLPCLCAQDRLEPVLRDLAAGRGQDVRFAHELVAFEQDDAGVHAVVAGPDGRYDVHADYLIAADGAHSPVRAALGIPRTGRGALGRAVTVYFRADLADIVRGREFNLCQIEDERLPGGFASVDGTEKWLFFAGDVAEQDWVRQLPRLIGAAVDVEILSVQAWEPAMRVADRFRAGRVFLAGDAAHVMPPYAAQGANTGIQDVHNLVWKLAAVLAGQAGTGLLDSYHAERHPTAYFAAEQSSLRTGSLRADPGFRGERPELAHPFVLMLGYVYEHGALIPDGGPPPATDRLELIGRPGTRVPHAWVRPGQTSTLDLCGPGFALLADGAGRLDDAGWLDGAGRLDGAGWLEAAARLGVPGHRLAAVDWLDPGGALLVRPDAVVAWRADGPVADPAAVLSGVLDTVLDRHA